MFGETEFGGLMWFTYAVLALMLLVGYSIWRVQQAKRKKRERWEPPADRRTALERELQAEIDAAEKRGPIKALQNTEAEAEAEAESETEGEPVLEPLKQERERMEELKRRVGE